MSTSNSKNQNSSASTTSMITTSSQDVPTDALELSAAAASNHLTNEPSSTASLSMSTMTNLLLLQISTGNTMNSEPAANSSGLALPALLFYFSSVSAVPLSVFAVFTSVRIPVTVMGSIPVHSLPLLLQQQETQP